MSPTSIQNNLCGILLAITLSPDPLSAQTVPPLAGEGGTARFSNWVITDRQLFDQISVSDTLELQLLDIEIRRQQEKVRETSFWRRLMPAIHFSASFGIRDLVYVDPTSFTPYVLPRDSYRLTMSISLNDAFDSPTHNQAVGDLERLRGQLQLRRGQIDMARRTLTHELVASRENLSSLLDELALVQQLLRFNELRFRQGRIEFDALARTKLELIAVQRSIQQIRQQQSELQLKLSKQ